MYKAMSSKLEGISVSSGTMRPDDLIPSFVSFIRDIEGMDTEVLAVKLKDLDAEIAKGDEYFESDDAQYDLEYLFDILDTCAPDGYYFGAHPGDGSDYGFWQCEDIDFDLDLSEG